MNPFNVTITRYVVIIDDNYIISTKGIRALNKPYTPRLFLSKSHADDVMYRKYSHIKNFKFVKVEVVINEVQ